MRTVDNLYILNYLINRQLRKGGELTALFVVLKAGFDSVEDISKDNGGKE